MDKYISSDGVMLSILEHRFTASPKISLSFSMISPSVIDILIESLAFSFFPTPSSRSSFCILIADWTALVALSNTIQKASPSPLITIPLFFSIGIFLATSGYRDILDTEYFTLIITVIIVIISVIWEGHWFSRLSENDIIETEDNSTDEAIHLSSTKSPDELKQL